MVTNLLIVTLLKCINLPLNSYLFCIYVFAGESTFKKRKKDYNVQCIQYVTRYRNIDHLQFFIKIMFRAWIDSEFSVEFNGQIARF